MHADCYLQLERLHYYYYYIILSYRIKVVPHREFKTPRMLIRCSNTLIIAGPYYYLHLIIICGYHFIPKYTGLQLLLLSICWSFIIISLLGLVKN